MKQLTGQPLRVWLPAIRANSGADIFTTRLAQGLRDAGQEPVIQWFDHWMELTPGRLRRAPVPAGTDIIHAGSWQGFALKRAGVPLIVTEHHDVMDPAYRPYKSAGQALYHSMFVSRWMARSYAAADRVTAVSDFTSTVLRKRRSMSVDTVQNWIDTDRFHPAAPRDDGSRTFQILFVGNHSRRKGGDVIFELAKRLGAGFQISCTGGLRRSSPDGGDSSVRLLGRLSEDDLIAAYRDCDAVLVPSRYEGFGYTALEGMACGKPVVGFDCGALKEVVGQSGAGFLVPIDDTEALASICRRLRDDRPALASTAKKARLRACEFSQSTSIARYMDIYRDALCSGRQASSAAKGGGKS